ncbi:hypothetical protein [Saccharibacillus endophyticus]|uniref:Uncharacterized protein n=1 Tax=Saccharibacillus endophyticus TaxID=2060666 RepID=A0ABQ1ZUQ6_9BACL|nr:hypothetical protein [Saccharibacillus endophyticus]GGH76729.1 hypothetical protein GCM10007362_19410 [Saccharibacillus endophyticus]
MQHFRSDLEKKIDDFINKFNLSEEIKKSIICGEASFLNENYGFDFDAYSEQWCFRSMRKDEEFSEECKEVDHTFSERTEDLENYLINTICDLRDSINDNELKKSKNPSYSKFLAAPLFKYKRGNGPLVINKLFLNSVGIGLNVHCFDWIGEKDIAFDRFGNERQRYHIEDFYIIVPFKDLFSKQKLKNYIYDELKYVFEERNGMMSIDNITFVIKNITLDVSKVSRKVFDDFLRKYGGNYHLKRYASYKKDQEVITTHEGALYKAFVLRNQKAIQMVRFIYLLKIGNWYNDYIDDFISSMLKNTYSHFLKLDYKDIEAIRWIITYLSCSSKVAEEREIYANTLKKRAPYKFTEKDSISSIFNFAKNENYFERDFEEELLEILN